MSDRMSASNRSRSFRRKSTRLFAALILLALAMCLGVARPASPKEKLPPWAAKDWTQWTWENCISVLNFSPWSQYADSYTIGSSGSASSLVQLRSALPVRQALLRNLQIHKHYDKMDAQKKQEFDQENAGALNEQAIDNVVIVIDNDRVWGESRDSSPPDPGLQIALRLSDGTLVLPIQTNKVSYPPASVEANTAHNQFEYVFPRMIAGRPLYSPSDIFLTIDQGDPLVVDKKTGKVEPQPFRDLGDAHGLKLKISRLMYKGKLEY